MTHDATRTMCITLAGSLEALGKAGPVTLEPIDVQQITQTLTRAANALRTLTPEADDGSHS